MEDWDRDSDVLQEDFRLFHRGSTVYSRNGPKQSLEEEECGDPQRWQLFTRRTGHILWPPLQAGNELTSFAEIVPSYYCAVQ